MNKENTVKYTIAIPFLTNEYTFSISRKTNWSIIDYLFLKELSQREMTVKNLSDFSNLETQVVIQILLPMCNVGWIDIVTSRDSFIFRITEMGEIAYSLSVKEHELICKVDKYQRKREVFVDYFDNYYSVYSFDSLLLTHARYMSEINKNKNIVTLPIDDSNSYPKYTKMYSVMAREHEKIDNVRDEAVYTLTTKKYLLVDMLYIEGRKEGRIIDDNKVKKLNEKLIRQITNTLPAIVKDDNSLLKAPLSKDGNNYEIKVIAKRGDVDFVYGGHNTKAKLIELIQSSTDFLVIHSTFIGKWCIVNDDGYTHLFLEIKEALKRGVQVYILWGKSNAEETDENFEKSDTEDKAVEKKLRDFNESCHQEGMLNVVNYNDFRRTDSHAKFVITNHVDKGLCTMVSSCNFLYAKFERFEASVVVCNDQFTKYFLEIAANICCGKSTFDSKVRKEFRGLSSNIADTPNDVDIPNNEKLELRLVLKHQHHSYIDLAAQAKNKIYIISDFINTSPIRPIFDALKKSEAKKYYYYSKKSSYIDHSEIVEMHDDLKSADSLSQLGAHHSNSHAKVLAWDNNDLLITSLNWLSASAPNNLVEIYHEIGVYVQGWDVAKDFIKVFRSI